MSAIVSIVQTASKLQKLQMEKVKRPTVNQFTPLSQTDINS